MRCGASLAARTRSAGRRAAARHYNFGSSEYLACFGDLPVPDGARLRRDAVAYVEGFDGGAWPRNVGPSDSSPSCRLGTGAKSTRERERERERERL